MLLFVTIIHFIVAILLVTFVLIQDSKGMGAFGMGGSTSNQVFSATGAANFLVTATRTLAILFALTCITLTYLTTKRQSGGSVVDDFAPNAGIVAPSGAVAPSGSEPVGTVPPSGSVPANQNPAQSPAESK